MRMLRNQSRQMDGKTYLTIAIETALFLVCAYGVYKSCWMNSLGVSLWLDEASLAFSFSKRSFWNLTSEILEWNQSAPVGWLYINKLLSIVFGNTEFVLRMFSVFSYTVTLILIYGISKKYFHLRLPLLCPAYIASMSFALQYSIMFKPYVSDGMFTMITILAYLKYKEKNRKIGFLSFVWAILLWFSNPVCFVAGGLILSEFSFALLRYAGKAKRNKFDNTVFLSEIKPWILTSVILITSFLIYYFYWLRPVAIGAPMQDFWKGQNFPLFPKSVEDLSKMKSMKEEIFTHFCFLTPIMMFGLITTLIFGIYSKNRTVIGLYLGLLLMLFASSINMFPVEDRMWYYFYPLASLLFFIGIDKLFHFDNEKKGIATLIVLAIFGLYVISGNEGFERYTTKDKVYRSGEELNYEIEYLRRNIKEDEKVYVYWYSAPGFQYKNGYDSFSIGNYDNNVIFGTSFFYEGDDYQAEIKKITNAHNCYIAMSHMWWSRVYGIKHDLPQFGWLELVRNDYNTPLLYWTDDIDNTKSRVNLSVSKKTEVDGVIRETIRIENIGETILNSQFSPVKLAAPEYGLLYDITKEIKPGKAVKIDVEYSADYSPVFKLVDATDKEVCPDAEIGFNEIDG